METTMRYMLFAIVSAALLATSAAPIEKPNVAPAKASPLMAEKLKNSQKLLEGLALNDFDKIQQSAEELMRISKAAEWGAIKTPMYEVHTNNFRRAAEQIIKKAKDKNIDGATLAYLDMTLTCVRCHQHTREVRNTSFEPRFGD
jgi:cytochrome c556